MLCARPDGSAKAPLKIALADHQNLKLSHYEPRGGLLQQDDQNASVRVIAAAGGVFRALHRIWWQIVRQAFRLAGGLQGLADVIPFAIHCGIDLVGNATVALVFFESDVVRAGSRPYGLPVPGHRGLPDSEVVAAGYDGIRLSQFISVILLPPEQIERAHGHLQIVFLLVGLEHGLEDRLFVVGIGDAPAGGVQSVLHLLLGPDQDEVHHVALIVELIVYPPGQAVDVLLQARIQLCRRDLQRDRG